VPSSRVSLLVLLCALTFFVGLGRASITDSDEAFYAQGAREMVDRGDWITPHYNGQFRFEKPVLYYWLAALGYLALDVGEFAARLPSALAGLVLVLTTYACARRWYDEATGFLAGAITATSFGYVAVARQALPDLALACFIVLGTWAALVALVAPRPVGPDPRRRWWLVLAGAALAGAFLTKGPVGAVLPALAVGPLALWRCWSERHARPGGARVLVGRLALDVSLLALACLLLTTPWFAAMTAIHGVAYLDRFFIDENLQRFVTNQYNAPRPFWYYLPIVAGGLLPWSPLMVVWWPPFRRVVQRARRLQPVEIWLTVWALTPLLFYSLSDGQQPRYILPVLPPLAILLARAVSGRLTRPDPSADSPRRDRLLAAAGAVSGAVIVLFGVFVYRAQTLLVGVAPATILIGTVLLVASGLGVSVVAISSRQRLLPGVLVVASVVSTLTAHYVVLSRPGPEAVEEMAALVRTAGPQTMAYGRYRVFVRNLLFYTGRPHVELASEEQVRAFLESTEPVLCVLAETDLRRARGNGVTAHELGRVSYLNTGSLTFRTLVWPDPSTDLETVVLVTNQAPP
jgi:4-amino-4-deoxy-L-arabinose transferase-like glycosyltransferase